MTNELTQNQQASAAEATPRAFAAPSVDIYESKGSFLVMAELPGVSADDVKIGLERDQLSLEARRSDQDIDYRRRFTLSVPVDAEGISARLEHGVLRLELPKAAEAQPRTIPVVSA